MVAGAGCWECSSVCAEKVINCDAACPLSVKCVCAPLLWAPFGKWATGVEAGLTNEPPCPAANDASSGVHLYSRQSQATQPHGLMQAPTTLYMPLFIHKQALMRYVPGLCVGPRTPVF